MTTSFEDEMQKVISKWEENVGLISTEMKALWDRYLWDKQDMMDDVEGQHKMLQRILSLKEKKNLLNEMIADVKAIL